MADKLLHDTIKCEQILKTHYLHLNRWYEHIRSFSETERDQFSECGKDFWQHLQDILDKQVN